MKRVGFICGIIIMIVGAGISFVFGGIVGLSIWCALSVFVLIEVVYHFGARGSLARSFRSPASSDVPDTRIETTTQGPRGYYDLDYRGRGRN